MHSQSRKLTFKRTTDWRTPTAQIDTFFPPKCDRLAEHLRHYFSVRIAGAVRALAPLRILPRGVFDKIQHRNRMSARKKIKLLDAIGRG